MTPLTPADGVVLAAILLGLTYAWLKFRPLMLSKKAH
jgi:hypothetical protein